MEAQQMRSDSSEVVGSFSVIGSAGNTSVDYKRTVDSSDSLHIGILILNSEGYFSKDYLKPGSSVKGKNPLENPTTLSLLKSSLPAHVFDPTSKDSQAEIDPNEISRHDAVDYFHLRKTQYYSVPGPSERNIIHVSPTTSHKYAHNKDGKAHLNLENRVTIAFGEKPNSKTYEFGTINGRKYSTEGEDPLDRAIYSTLMGSKLPKEVKRLISFE